MKRKLRNLVIVVSIAITSIAFSQDIFAQTQRNPVLEECTGTWCQWCPCGHTVMAQILAAMPNAIMIGYHGPLSYPDPWKNFPGNEIINLLAFTGYPTAVIDRTSAPMSRSAWAATMNARYNVPATVSITMDKSFNIITRELNADIHVTALENLTGEYKLSFLLLEDGLVYSQTGNGSCPGASDYIHHHVVRAMINGATGEVLNGVNPWNQGQTITKNIQYTVPSVVVPDSCELVAFVYKVVSPLYNGNIQQGEKWDLVSPDYVATMNSSSPDVIIENSSAAEFSAVLYNQGLLNDTYNITASIDGPAGWMGEFTTENGTFPFGELDSVQVIVGDSTEISATVNPNGFNGSGTLTIEYSSKNDPGIVGYVSFNLVTNTGVPGLVIDASGEEFADLLLNAINQEFEYPYGIVSREALYTGIDLTNFIFIGWSTGNAYPVFTEDEVDALMPFLDNGGRLLINGQNIGEDIFEGTGQSQFAQSFYNNYLHASYVSQWPQSYSFNGLAGDPIGDQLSFQLNNIYAKDPDEFTPYDTYAASIFKVGVNSRYNSIRADDGIDRIVYLGFGLEQIDDQAIRDTIIARSIRLLMNGILVDNPGDETILTSFTLEQNYPNPFNPATTIVYSIPKESQVNLKIYDVMGREVAELVSGKQSTGSYNVEFDAASLASGTYFYKLVAGDFISVKKMILLK